MGTVKILYQLFLQFIKVNSIIAIFSLISAVIQNVHLTWTVGRYLHQPCAITLVPVINHGSIVDKLKHRQQFPVGIKFYWLLNIICTTNAIIVTTLYWALVYNKGDIPDVLDLNNILTHACNSIFLVFDLMVTAIPVRLLHVIYPFVYELIYTTFTVVYYLFGGKNA